jgi:nicotinate-nucleotide--dimethylbenzimidazole phosphoribosyltransferase
MTHCIAWLNNPIAKPDENFRQAAIQRQQQLTKPPGSLGKLETLAIDLCALQRTNVPVVDQVKIVIFAADHGVAVENISAFPQSVTGEMIRNFAAGGAAINVLARFLGAALDVINLGTVSDLEFIEGVRDERLGSGTANFIEQAAMSTDQLMRAIKIGRSAVLRANQNGAHMFVAGEMGIGNTTSASALASALLKLDPVQIAGPGTGLDTTGVKHKVKVIEKALQSHGDTLSSPLDVLRCLGGFEIAALTGSYLACAQTGLPVLIDGFICTVAALMAVHIAPDAKDWFIYSHTSAEPGHQLVLDALEANPLINLGMRLGEGSGAAMAVPLLDLACRLHNKMATFTDAGISEQQA